MFLESGDKPNAVVSFAAWRSHCLLSVLLSLLTYMRLIPVGKMPRRSALLTIQWQRRMWHKCHHYTTPFRLTLAVLICFIRSYCACSTPLSALSRPSPFIADLAWHTKPDSIITCDGHLYITGGAQLQQRDVDSYAIE
jgi:hypothetical protein